MYPECNYCHQKLKNKNDIIYSQIYPDIFEVKNFFKSFFIIKINYYHKECFYRVFIEYFKKITFNMVNEKFIKKTSRLKKMSIIEAFFSKKRGGLSVEGYSLYLIYSIMKILLL